MCVLTRYFTQFLDRNTFKLSQEYNVHWKSADSIISHGTACLVLSSYQISNYVYSNNIIKDKPCARFTKLHIVKHIVLFFILRQWISPPRFKIILSAAFDNRNWVAIVKRSAWHTFDNYIYVYFNIVKRKLRKFVTYIV